MVTLLYNASTLEIPQTLSTLKEIVPQCFKFDSKYIFLQKTKTFFKNILMLESKEWLDVKHCKAFFA